MKVQFLAATVAVAALLSACGEKHEHVQAVDKLKEAQDAAMAKAPKPESVKFDDDGQPTFAETSGAAAKADAADAKTDAAAPADAAKTDAAPADAKADEAKADDAKADAKEEAKSAEAAATDAKK